MRLNDLVLEKGKTKVSWLISFHSLIRQCFNTLIRHSNVRRIWPICAFDQMRSASDQLAKRAAFDQMRNYDTIQLIDIVWHHHSLGQLTSHHWLDNIKTTVSQQYTSFVFPFAETRSVDATSVDRENTLWSLSSSILITRLYKYAYCLNRLPLPFCLLAGRTEVTNDPAKSCSVHMELYSDVPTRKACQRIHSHDYV